MQYFVNRQSVLAEKFYEKSKNTSLNPLSPKSVLQILLCLTPQDFTLSNAKRFYSSKGDPLGLKGLNE